MNKAYLTRKNLLIISCSFFYSLIVLFTGLCIDASNSVMSKKNPISLFAKALGFELIDCSASGLVGLILVSVYITVFIGAVLYIRRFAILNNKKQYSPQILIAYFVSFIICVALSYGLTLLIQSPLDKTQLRNITLYLTQAIGLGLLIFVFLGLLVGGVLMFIVNFINVDKPYRFFGKRVVESTITKVDEIETDIAIADSFDKAPIQGSFGPVEATASTNVVTGGVQQTVQAAVELDDREKVFPSLSFIDERYNAFKIDKIETDNYTLEEICVKFRNYLAKEEKLYFSLDNIRLFISGLAASHFMILEGLSGTGKSSLPRFFSKFTNSSLLFTAVQATWRDRSNILGYFNDFSKTYSETDFLVQLYEANYNPDQINIFVLDEMNISRVEYYFADMLSVLEYPVDSWRLRLMHLPSGFVAPAMISDGFIQIPENSYFIGTANKDDSTFSISDKVYDRAITIDFSYRNAPFEVDEEVETIKLSHSKLKELYNEALENDEYQMTVEDYSRFEKITNLIYEEFDITFGNRILNQISKLIPVFMACGGKKETALDFLLSRKILVKIEGRFEEYVKNSLKKLLGLLEATYGPNTFEQSERIIKAFMKRL